MQIFISYARADERLAEQAAGALRDAGFEVWRDNELPAHRAYGEVIEERLGLAEAVLVLWSAEAAKSQWVRAEADSARAAGKLVQASIDGIIPPLPFNQIQCADLNGWSGDVAAPGWKKIASSLGALAAIPAPAKPAGSPKRAFRGLSVCVLPFQNMSGDPEQEYFSDGISEDITTDLSKVSALAVTARHTAFQFKDRSLDVPEVAGKLGVSHVLEGSVRKAGNRVRITAQLIDGASGGHVWAERYDRELDDIFAIQDEISKAIVDALKVRLLPSEKDAIEVRGTENAEAYDFYLMARNHWLNGNHGDRRREERVIRLCQRAVEIDPAYARAWALLSIAQSNLRFGFGVQGDDGTAAAETALALDSSVAEAYCAKARPHREAGNFEESLKLLDTGLKLDPDSWDLHKAKANLLMSKGKVAEALVHYTKAAELVDSDYHAWGMMQCCHRALGDVERTATAAKMSMERAQQVLAEDPHNGSAISFAITGLATIGEHQKAREMMDRALLIDPDNLNMRYNFACVLAAIIGDREGALEMVKRSITEVKGSLGNAEFDPDLDLIRDDPQFQSWIAEAKAKRRSKSLES